MLVVAEEEENEDFFLCDVKHEHLDCYTVVGASTAVRDERAPH